MIEMKLFTTCPYCGGKFYLPHVYPSRREMPYELELRCPHCGSEDSYYPREIWAEPGAGGPLAGAAIGAIVGGIIGGPIGLILGGALGGSAGVSSDEKDQEASDRFNEEMV